MPAASVTAAEPNEVTAPFASVKSKSDAIGPVAKAIVSSMDEPTGRANTNALPLVSYVTSTRPENAVSSKVAALANDVAVDKSTVEVVGVPLIVESMSR